MSKIKLFLSSKVNPVFEGLDRKNYSLGDLRKFIKKEFESQLFLNEQLVSIIMNEEGFETSFDIDAFDACLKTVKSSDLIVVLYSGDAGWAPNMDPHTNGICHEEYLIAVQEHPSMTFGINISGYFTKAKYSKDQKRRNAIFEEDINSYYRFKEYSVAKTVTDLEKYIKRLLTGYIKKSISNAFTAKKEIDSGNTVFGKTLNWSKLSYQQRNKELKDISTVTFNNIFPKILCNFHAIPDHLSVSDARNFLGRPFLNEHKGIHSAKNKMGVIHFITVYGNVTENQCKNTVGYPDVTLIRTSFGYYLWEQTVQIQLFFISKCINPSVVRTRKQQIINWIKSSKERSNIELRSQERYNILKAIVNATKKTK